jgi:carboxyl-terminal processing protease
VSRALRAARWALLSLAGAAALIAVLVVVRANRDETRFARLSPQERRLAVYDAFAHAVAQNYYDRAFIDQQWEPLRAAWRLEAANARDDVSLYDHVFMQLSQKVPSSHIAAIPPPSLVAGARQKAADSTAAPRVDRDFGFAPLRRNGGLFVTVDLVRAGSAAAAAGIEPGWMIVTLPGCREGRESAVFMTMGTPEQRLAFEAGDTMTLDPSIKDTADFETKYRRTVQYECRPPVTAPEPFELRRYGDALYIRCDTFSEPKLIDQVLGAFDAAGARGVVLDLRRNSGGQIVELRRLLNQLLPKDAWIGTQVIRAHREELRVDDGPHYTGPLAVLVGPATASAAEVAAASLQDQQRAILVGRSTAGATLPAMTVALPDGGQASVAFADFVRANGQRIEGAGVRPDIGVMPTLADVGAGRDAALERALEVLGRATASGSRLPPR